MLKIFKNINSSGIIYKIKHSLYAYRDYEKLLNNKNLRLNFSRSFCENNLNTIKNAENGNNSTIVDYDR